MDDNIRDAEYDAGSSPLLDYEFAEGMTKREWSFVSIALVALFFLVILFACALPEASRFFLP